MNDAIKEFRGALSLDPTQKETYDALALALTLALERGWLTVALALMVLWPRIRGVRGG